MKRFRRWLVRRRIARLLTQAGWPKSALPAFSGTIVVSSSQFVAGADLADSVRKAAREELP